ncbi:MAG: transposase [Cytophaga sp.]|uniref:transposase n=1 Tax=Cytophaga sp. TaxID=29535 RepID=UPI003F819F58
MEKIIYHPEFFTGTILNWQKLLKPEKYKSAILEELTFMVHSNKIILYAFCIMDNHIHLIWQFKGDKHPSIIKRSFFTRTAHHFKKDLKVNHPNVLEYFRSTQEDRKYHFWERRSLGINLFTDKIFEQKLDYIHSNPVKANLCEKEEDYKYSSAAFYLTGKDEWNILTHYKS